MIVRMILMIIFVPFNLLSFWKVALLIHEGLHVWVEYREFTISFSFPPCSEDGVDRHAVDLLPGNQYILRYSPISSLVDSGAVKLI